VLCYEDYVIYDRIRVGGGINNWNSFVFVVDSTQSTEHRGTLPNMQQEETTRSKKNTHDVSFFSSSLCCFLLLSCLLFFFVIGGGWWIGVLLCFEFFSYDGGGE
jgi:hypothetical protein